MGEAMRRRIVTTMVDSSTQTESEPEELKVSKRTVDDCSADDNMWYDHERMMQYVKNKKVKIQQLQVELANDIEKIKNQLDAFITP